MKHLNHYFFFLAILMTGFCNVKAQSNTNFEFEVQTLEENRFEFIMNISNPDNVQFIEIGFLDNPEDDFATEIFTASLNKKKDNAYYFFLDNKEYKININEFAFQVQREFINEADLEQKGVYIKLLDTNFIELDTYQKVITN